MAPPRARRRLVRLTLGGFAGVTLGLREGIEVNLLGLVAGVRFRDPALILPGFGALGERF